MMTESGMKTTVSKVQKYSQKSETLTIIDRKRQKKKPCDGAILEGTTRIISSRFFKKNHEECKDIVETLLLKTGMTTTFIGGLSCGTSALRT